MRVLKCILVGGLLVSASQAFAEDDPAAEIKLLKAKLKQLEQRVDDQGRKERQIEAQTRALPPVGAYKAAASACAYGKVCYKGVTLTFGGWVDLTGIYRTRNLASDTGSVYNFIPYPQAKNYNTPESRFSARQSRFSVLAEGNVDSDTHLAGYGEIDFEGAAQTANSVATNSFNPRMRQLSLEIDRTDLGFHVLAGQSWSLNAPSKIGIDPRGVDAPGVIDFESVPGFLAARQPGIRVWQDIGPEFKIAASAENPQTAFFGGNTPTVGTPAVGPQGVLNPNLLVNLTGPGGSFFNNANNISLNQVPDLTVKAAWDPRLGPYHLHVEAWALYRQFFDRFNFANHTYDTGIFRWPYQCGADPEDAGAAGLWRPWCARPLYGHAVPGCDAGAGRHDHAAFDHGGRGRPDLAHAADARPLYLCRSRKDQGGILRCRHRAVRLRQSALQQHRLQYRELAGRDLQRQHPRGHGSSPPASTTRSTRANTAR